MNTTLLNNNKNTLRTILLALTSLFIKSCSISSIISYLAKPQINDEMQDLTMNAFTRTDYSTIKILPLTPLTISQRDIYNIILKVNSRSLLKKYPPLTELLTKNKEYRYSELSIQKLAEKFPSNTEASNTQYPSIDFNAMSTQIELDINNMNNTKATSGIFSEDFLNLYERDEIITTIFMESIKDGNLAQLKEIITQGALGCIQINTSDEKDDSVWHKFALCKQQLNNINLILSNKTIYYSTKESDFKVYLSKNEDNTEDWQLKPKLNYSAHNLYFTYAYDNSKIYKNKDNKTPINLALENNNDIALKYFVTKGTKIYRSDIPERGISKDQFLLTNLAAFNTVNKNNYAGLKKTNENLYEVFEILLPESLTPYYHLRPFEADESIFSEISKEDINVRNTKGLSILECLILNIHTCLSPQYIATIDTSKSGSAGTSGLDYAYGWLRLLEMLYLKLYPQGESYSGMNYFQYNIKEHMKSNVLTQYYQDLRAKKKNIAEIPETLIPDKFNYIVGVDAYNNINAYEIDEKPLKEKKLSPYVINKIQSKVSVAKNKCLGILPNFKTDQQDGPNSPNEIDYKSMTDKERGEYIINQLPQEDDVPTSGDIND